MLRCIKQDLSRIASPTVLNAVKWYVFPRGECFDFVVWLRIQQWVRRHRWFNLATLNIVNLLTYVIYRHFEFKYGIHANVNTEIGPGFRPVHGPCNLNVTKIGANFTVYPGVTIGVNRGRVPTVGDNVTIYTNAVVCGGIMLGDGAVVRALEYVGHSR